MLFLLCECAGKQVENALGHHPGALPPSDVLPGGEDKDISLLFRAQAEEAQ